MMLLRPAIGHLKLCSALFLMVFLFAPNSQAQTKKSTNKKQAADKKTEKTVKDAKKDNASAKKEKLSAKDKAKQAELKKKETADKNKNRQAEAKKKDSGRERESKKLAEINNLPAEEVARITTYNAEKIFNC